MEKIVKVDGRDVRLKSTAAFPLRYNALTGKDYFVPAKNATERFYDIVWVLAKCADDSIPPLMEWVESFDEFPVIDLFNQGQELIDKSMGATRKNAKAAAGK